MKSSEIPFTFITEDGSTTLTIPQYHTRQDLMDKIGLITTPPRDRRTVFCGTTIASFPDSLIAKDPQRRRILNELEEVVTQNPLAYFVPQNDTVRELLNDTEHDLKGFVAPNGTGKSVCGWIDVLLDIIPCDPKWPIFATHGVKHRTFRGPYDQGGVGIVSYEWANHQSTIWPQIIKRWTPVASLGEYAKNMVINWRNNPKCDIAGTPVYFLACSQAQTVFEAAAMNIYWWDEQGMEAKFNGANARVRRRGGRHVFTLTPHKIEGRPDTGAGSWIEKLYRKEVTAGLNTMFYHCDLKGLPDWVFSEKAKRDVITEWVDEPMKNNDIKKLREGRSRVYGEFHETSGLVFDEFSVSHHIIEPFEIPKNWTRYRGFDHGRVNPTAGLACAVSPQNDIVVYWEYYKANQTINENVKGIIDSLGNSRRRVERIPSNDGTFVERFEEVQKAQRFRRSVLDSRSFAKKTDNSALTIGQMYRNAGLYVIPADGQQTDIQVNLVKDLMRIDPERKHIETGNAGAPQIYFFSTLHNFRKEMMSYTNEFVTRTDRFGMATASERPRHKDDHLMTALLYLCMNKPTYIHNPYEEELDLPDEQKVEARLVVDSITGY